MNSLRVRTTQAISPSMPASPASSNSNCEPSADCLSGPPNCYAPPQWRIYLETSGKTVNRTGSRHSRIPEVKLHLYGKLAPRPGRKMGHLTALAADFAAALSLLFNPPETRFLDKANSRAAQQKPLWTRATFRPILTVSVRRLLRSPPDQPQRRSGDRPSRLPRSSPALPSR